ncbi:hypothetical protein HWV62_25110 [Athelia sp. TMB]|nr:hypothetical protein HWV62_25110 [Athelia sp. TMB]
MKRPLQALVSYSSSDDDSEHDDPKSLPELSLKKRKLPPLPSSLRPAIPIDKPELHQGRTRSSPHVEGQWAAHIYVPVTVEVGSALGRLLDDALRDAKELVPSLIDIGTQGAAERHVSIPGVGDASENKVRCGERELHISLSRPTYLRAHQREDLKRAIKAVAKACAPVRFKASFATFSELTNDEKTRTFLTLEVGAGHNEFQALIEALTPALRAIRQREFYSDPRFHASIGWALLDSCASSGVYLPSDPPSAIRTSTPVNSPSEQPSVVSPIPTSPTFPTIPHFPPTLVSSLVTKHSRQLTRPLVGAFEVGEVKVKIGREEYGWKMKG